MNLFLGAALSTGIGVTALSKAQKVLLVEDEPLLAMHYEDVLVGTEFKLGEPLVCNKQALERLAVHVPELAIVDFILADGPCLPILDKLQEMHVPLIIVSAFGDAEDAAAAWNAPILRKPFRDEELLRALRALATLNRSGAAVSLQSPKAVVPE